MESSKNVAAGQEAGCLDNIRDEDAEWLSSLTEHELDFLISLKELATTKAKSIGRKDLSKKFDIKVLRALGFILLEYIKERVRNTPAIPDADELLASLNGSGLSNLDCNRNHDNKASASKSSTKEFSFVSTRRKKRMWDGLEEGTTSSRSKKHRKTQG